MTSPYCPYTEFQTWTYCINLPDINDFLADRTAAWSAIGIIVSPVCLSQSVCNALHCAAWCTGLKVVPAWS